MKTTRKQLIKIIAEAIINEMPMIKPGGDMDPEYSEKLTGMIDTGDEGLATQADELAQMLGYEGDSFSQDLKMYDQVGIMGAVGEFAHYLTDEHMKKIMYVADKVLIYKMYSWTGFGFGFNPHSTVISPDDFREMQYRIAAKKKDITDDDIEEHEGMDTGVAAAHDLVQAIMSLSKKTYVSRFSIEDAGIGHVHTPKVFRKGGQGGISFYDPEYEALYKAEPQKLVITRN